jgi:hypothetical protein
LPEVGGTGQRIALITQFTLPDTNEHFILSSLSVKKVAGEYSPDVGFNDAGQWTPLLGVWTVAGSQLTMDDGVGNTVPNFTLVDGDTFIVTVDIETNNDLGFDILIGGARVIEVPEGVVGIREYEVQPEVTTQAFGIGTNRLDGSAVINRLSIRKKDPIAMEDGSVNLINCLDQ